MRLIDADELKEVMCRSAVDTREKIGNIIDNAPTVAVNCKDCDGYEAGYSAGLKDAERPQGEWIKITSPLSNEIIVKCPFCHDEFIGNDVEHYNYCPNCGAQMQRGNNNDTGKKE